MLSAVGAGAQDKRIDQFRYNDMVMAGDAATAFNAAFEASDELTEHNFTAEQGVGAQIGEGRLFARIPSADLTSDQEWANHLQNARVAPTRRREPPVITRPRQTERVMWR